MTLTLMSAAAGSRSGWRLAGAVLLVLLALGGASTPGRTEDAGADPYTATVTVDATADTVVKARDMARLDGERRALAAVVERLAGGSAPAKLPKLDDQAITDLVSNYEVANERMSAVRYVADYTFHFQAAGVQRLLGNAGGAASAVPGKPLIVIPVYQSGAQSRLWGDPNPWREAWGQRSPGTGAIRLVVPLGDAGDVAAIDAGKALAGDAAALAAIARRNGGGDAVVALAATRGSPDSPTGLDVTVRHYRAGQLVDSHAEPLSANPGESEGALLSRAVLTIASEIESGWKDEPVPGYDQEGSLTAVLPITGLDDWVHAHERLATVPAIRKMALIALSREEATIEIGYVGSIDQSKASLAAISLDLVRGDRPWRLARTGPGGTP